MVAVLALVSVSTNTIGHDSIAVLNSEEMDEDTNLAVAPSALYRKTWLYACKQKRIIFKISFNNKYDDLYRIY